MLVSMNGEQLQSLGTVLEGIIPSLFLRSDVPNSKAILFLFSVKMPLIDLQYEKQAGEWTEIWIYMWD